MTRRVAALVCGLSVVSVATVVALGDASLDPRPSWWALVPFVALLASAEYLFVRFRYRGEVDAINPFEAVVAPVLIAFPVWTAVAAVAVAQVAGAVVRRNMPLKASFNVAQWSAATVAGAATLHALAGPESSAGATAAALLAGMIVIGVVNQLAFVTVLWLVDPQPPAQLLRALAPVIAVGWGVAWALNTIVGFVFAFSYRDLPVLVAVYGVPLVILHAASRAYAGMRVERSRLAGIQRAGATLSAPFDPLRAVDGFLQEVVKSFDARAAELVLVGAGERLRLHRYDASAGYTSRLPSGAGFDRVLMDVRDTTRFAAGDADGLLAAAGWRDCLASPVAAEDRRLGVLAVYDQVGLEGFEEAERSALETLARETAGIFEKGELLAEVLEERRKLVQIVDHTSDGIVTLTADGIVRSWNPGIASITRVDADDIVGRHIRELRTFDRVGEPVSLADWSSGVRLPSELRVATAAGVLRWLSCSYSITEETDERPALVVVARDVTKHLEVERLRHEYDQVVEREAIQRQVVTQLQEAFRPPLPDVRGVELAVSYQPSDPSAPTGGDLYDWQCLPDGSLYVAVVDVTGKGVVATKDALAVVHALRLLVLDCYELDVVVRRADELVCQRNPKLSATVMIAVIDPHSGVVRIASGGHPPALLARGGGTIEEIDVFGTPIGWPGAGSDGVVSCVLEPGDTLVLYTDGLVEARKDIVEGIASLSSALADARDEPVDDMARVLVERSLAGAARHDDSLALVVRRSASGSRWAYEDRVPGGKALAAARRRFRDWLGAEGADEAVCDDLVLVLSELVTNALQAEASQVDVRAVRDGDDVVLEVADDGPGAADDLTTRFGSPPDPAAERGRGLYLVGRMADDVVVASGDDGVLVRCRRRVVDEGAEAVWVDRIAMRG